MAFEPFIIWLFVGVIAGWASSVLAKDYGYGLFRHIGVGTLGAFVGAWLFKSFGLAADGGSWGATVGAAFGAIALLALVRFIRTPRNQV
jgi:uncharacterized membrane protein YeaQ/YmgE (transglycosylase-associated protein family)